MFNHKKSKAMEQKININSEEWCELVFAGKNHEYGAFPLRMYAAGRQSKSLIIACTLFTMAICTPLILKKIKNEPRIKIEDVIYVSPIDPYDKQDEDKIIPADPVPRKVNSFKFADLIIKSDKDVKDDDMKTQDELANSNFKISFKNVIGDNYIAGQDTLDLNTNRMIAEDDIGPVFKGAEQQPVFPGGEEELVKFLGENIKYPVSAREQGIEGIVYVSFVVSKAGKIVNVKLLRGIIESCDDEAQRVIKMMPDWLPGKQNGVPVSVEYNLPISFQLKN